MFPLLSPAVSGVVGGLLAIGAGIGLLYVFARPAAIRLRQMLGTSTTDVGAIDGGPVEIEGTVRSAGQTVDHVQIADAEGADVVLREYRRKSGSTDPDKQSLGEQIGVPVPQQFTPNALNDRTVVPFYIEDDTGRVLVDAAEAHSSLESDEQRHRNGMSVDESQVEALLLEGDDVYVIGEAIPTEEYDEDAVSKTGLRRILGMLTDLLSSPHEVPASEAIDEDDEYVVGKTSDDAVFVVSDTSERRTWLRQGLVLAFWSLLGVLGVAVGVVAIYLGVLG